MNVLLGICEKSGLLEFPHRRIILIIGYLRIVNPGNVHLLFLEENLMGRKDANHSIRRILSHLIDDTPIVVAATKSTRFVDDKPAIRTLS